ncbi:BAG family molecular chaperone regulator 4 [Zea mays]|uniref:BCL-2 binding anthanogene-1 n=2 Tax=Zea mays TaxID=4577 RepID=B6U8V5_MAIZE|nr:ubiquitin family protein [Zea mays]ACG45788.1 BCL-2 binding anthanogene-1 [Zea mays]AQK72330.1 BCL-2 binding anthanogene-1 [Zea mays]PWZ21586.1 BAG family molecular chaperone regulator 4 [Zea mays]|eukprot:NP_001152106.1 BCL-2 binding anthanogene-1 [Zea mays]
MIKLSYSKRLFKRISSTSNKQQAAASGGGGDNGSAAAAGGGGAREIEWEVRPGGMLVQKRDGRGGRETVAVRVSTGFSWHDVSIGATSTFGELKVMLSMVTGLEPREQRLLFRGKERNDTDHLHMVGVRDKDKVLLLEDPALKDMKLRALSARVVPRPCQSFIQV